jgi:hypothetical protein
MKCFRCEGRDFDVVKQSIFGLAVLTCSNCTQQFFVEEKATLVPVELLGYFEDIESECIITKCTICGINRYIAVDCTNLNLQSCGFCNAETKPVGNKIPLSEFLNRSSSIDGDAPVS